MPVRLETEAEENCLTAYLSGEIDHHAAKGLREAIDSRAAAQKPEKLLPNFREVTFMDSSGIGLVMGRYRLMQELGGELRVTGVPSHIRKVMRLSGLDKLAVMEPEGKRPARPRSPAKTEESPCPQDRPSVSGASPIETAKTLTVTIPVPPGGLEGLEPSPGPWDRDGRTE